MLKLQAKMLIAIFAALGCIAGAAIYQRHEEHKAVVLQEQFRRRVEQNKMQHNSAAGNEGKTWRSYIP